MKYLLIKDRRRRLLYSLYEFKRKVLLVLIKNCKLSLMIRYVAYKKLIEFPIDSSITRIRNRCTLTMRSRAVYRKFGISRIRFRKLANLGELAGMKKAI